MKNQILSCYSNLAVLIITLLFVGCNTEMELESLNQEESVEYSVDSRTKDCLRAASDLEDLVNALQEYNDCITPPQYEECEGDRISARIIGFGSIIKVPIYRCCTDFNNTEHPCPENFSAIEVKAIYDEFISYIYSEYPNHIQCPANNINITLDISLRNWGDNCNSEGYNRFIESTVYYNCCIEDPVGNVGDEF